MPLGNPGNCSLVPEGAGNTKNEARRNREVSLGGGRLAGGREKKVHKLQGVPENSRERGEREVSLYGPSQRFIEERGGAGGEGGKKTRW